MDRSSPFLTTGQYVRKLRAQNALMQKAIAVERPGSQSGTLDLSSLKVRAQNRGYMYIAPALYVDDDVGVYRQACSGTPLAVGFLGRDRLL